MKDTVIVFARAPRLGLVKRRLAREIGHRRALQFHARTLGRLLRKLGADRRFQSVLAITPDRARMPSLPAITRIGQGKGDLGQRMYRAFRKYRTARVALIGSDIPGLSTGDIASAFRALGRSDAVFGPAEDGGYWLIAMSPRRPARPFQRVRWSSRYTLGDTVENFAGRRVCLLRRLRDVDTAADLQVAEREGRRRFG
ncbi:MAG: TIGR04282 family arsenosugar biosynthesis glycosyltransferase [Acetobacteraceae bacterium]|nr:TIGR04282 family arsenosugar biosynthesis glycosyltransferase [Acetobacteraceae bacterium]